MWNFSKFKVCVECNSKQNPSGNHFKWTNSFWSPNRSEGMENSLTLFKMRSNEVAAILAPWSPPRCSVKPQKAPCYSRSCYSPGWDGVRNRGWQWWISARAGGTRSHTTSPAEIHEEPASKAKQRPSKQKAWRLCPKGVFDRLQGLLGPLPGNLRLSSLSSHNHMSVRAQLQRRHSFGEAKIQDLSRRAQLKSTIEDLARPQALWTWPCL